jgi:hypothetical protein
MVGCTMLCAFPPVLFEVEVTAPDVANEVRRTIADAGAAIGRTNEPLDLTGTVEIGPEVNGTFLPPVVTVIGDSVPDVIPVAN